MAAPSLRARLEARLTREWQRNSVWQVVLRPLSWIFAILVAMRRLAYRCGLQRRYRVARPVVVVGNLTVGGSGKTPLVIALVETLRAAGQRPGVISRGYGATRTERADTPLKVDAQAHDAAARFGDEPTLIQARLACPMFVCANRVAAAQALLAEYPETTVLVADDGLQHYALQRDIEIAVFNGDYGVGNGALLPAGPLREPLSRLKAVDALVIVGSGRTAHAQLSSAYAMRLGKERFVNLVSGERVSASEVASRFAGVPLHALAGIAEPRRFFSHLRRLGLRVHEHAFADHHPFCAADLDFPEDVVVLMTQKDAVKCRVFATPQCWVMEVDAILAPQFGEAILAQLLKVQKRRSPTTNGG